MFNGYHVSRKRNVVMTMTKRDLVARIARNLNIGQEDVMSILQMALDTITDELAAGNTIEFRNFGVFEVLKRKARVGRNPNRPKDVVAIPDRSVVKFKPGKEMRNRVLLIDPSQLD